MSNVPLPKMEIPNYTNYQPDQEMLRLRRRLGDLMRLGAATPETFQQAFLQVWQESERQRQQCMTAAEEHLRQYHQFVAQAHAFSMFSSIAYSVINGYVTIEERRAAELAEREKDKAAGAGTNGTETNGTAQEGAAPTPSSPPSEENKPSGGRRKKP